MKTSNLLLPLMLSGIVASTFAVVSDSNPTNALSRVFVYQGIRVELVESKDVSSEQLRLLGDWMMRVFPGMAPAKWSSMYHAACRISRFAFVGSLSANISVACSGLEKGVSDPAYDWSGTFPTEEAFQAEFEKYLNRAGTDRSDTVKM